MSEELIQTFRRKVLEGDTSHSDFFKSLKSIPISDLMELHRWIVRSVEYEALPSLVKDSFHYLAKNRDVSSLQILESLKDWWSNTYLYEYDYLIALLRNAANGAVCNCTVYADGQFNAAPYQDDLEILDRTKHTYDDFMEVDILTVKCLICGNLFKVEIDYSYHYPHSRWTRITDNPIFKNTTDSV